MDVYRVLYKDGNRLTHQQAEYAVKQYKTHRRIPLRILNADCERQKNPIKYCTVTPFFYFFQNVHTDFPKFELKYCRVKVIANVGSYSQRDRLVIWWEPPWSKCTGGDRLKTQPRFIIMHQLRKSSEIKI